MAGNERLERHQTFLSPWRKSVLLSVTGWLQKRRNSKLPVDTNATFKVPLTKSFTVWLFQWQNAFLASAHVVRRSGTKVCLVHLSSVSPYQRSARSKQAFCLKQWKWTTAKYKSSSLLQNYSWTVCTDTNAIHVTRYFMYQSSLKWSNRYEGYEKDLGITLQKI